MRRLEYQDQVLRDLSGFMDAVNNSNNLIKAWNEYWADRDIMPGVNGAPLYQNIIKGVPHVCMKVPTGGGKTYMACQSVKVIFDHLPPGQPKVVMWMVPSDSILTQTVQTLSNPAHPYRQRLDRDFGGRVGVYTKEMLLNGQNFSPETVREMLTICVATYASFRIDSQKKDIRKAFQENGNLTRFADYFQNKNLLLADTPDSALIHALRWLTPVEIVDESHNTGSKLSREMLETLNPSFILELTATPRESSNIISYVDALELKKANMVKLPVIVFKRNSIQTVVRDAIQLRNNIEAAASEEKRAGGDYIRPIALFQAQPNLNSKSETYNKIKTDLLLSGIPEEQIGIKTSEVDTIKGVDLMSPDCEIRYIITVNALKEGWDCPFAYVLASTANKTSKVDVQQIVGRILRQPYAKEHNNTLLNTSFVLSCSNDFHATVDNVIAGLNRSGFSRKDCRVEDKPAKEEPLPGYVKTDPNTKGTSGGPAEETESYQRSIFDKDNTSTAGEDGKTPGNTQTPDQDDIFTEVDAETLRKELERDPFGRSAASTDGLSSILESAIRQAEQYNIEIGAESESDHIGGELGKMLKQNKVRKQFRDEIKDLRIPCFVFGEAPSLFEVEYDVLEEENLSKGFSLSEQDAKINFSLPTGDAAAIDLETDGEAVPKYARLKEYDKRFYSQYLERFPEEQRIMRSSNLIADQINRNNRYNTKEVRDYVARVIRNMTEDELAVIETSIPIYAKLIQDKLSSLERVHREKTFKKWLDIGKIECRPSYKFPEVITPSETISTIPNSLYEEEWGDIDGFERTLIDAVVGTGNIRWWHRIIERKGFCLNGWFKHYPDFVVMTKSKKLLLIEAKGDHLDGENSREKLDLGRKWQDYAGRMYRYFMVFDKKNFGLDGAYTLNDFIDVMKEI